MIRKIASMLVVILGLASLSWGQSAFKTITQAFTATGNSTGISVQGGLYSHTLTWGTSGTISTCVVAIQSASTFAGAYTTVGTAQTCTSPGSYTVYTSGPTYVRLAMTTFTGSATPIVTVTYRGAPFLYSPTSEFVAPAAAASAATGSPLFSATAQAGGAQSATTGSGGTGGLISLTAGVGGAGGSVSGTGGTGGAITYTAGAGGGTVTGGTGGAVTIKAGAGGAGTSAGGSGGNFSVAAGAAGSGGTGTAGKFRILDAADNTKIAAFDVSNLTTAHTTTITVPEVNAALPIIPVMNHSASAVNAATLHIVRDTCILGTSCSVTFTGAAVFADTNYVCNAQDITAAAATRANISSGSAVAFTGTGTDTLIYTCIGN